MAETIDNERNDRPVRGELRLRTAADVHTHILPGIDDGAVDLGASVLMAAVAVRAGARLMTATPHRYYGGRENTPEVVRSLVSQVREALAEYSWGRLLDLRPGQECPLTMQLVDELEAGIVMTLNDTGRYILVEPPFEHLPAWAPRAIERIVAAGYVPVLAHPERNADVQRDPARAEPLAEAGALIQLTAMSVSGVNGPAALNASHWILDRGLAALISSDCHGSSWRPPTMRSAFHAVRRRYGIELARRLCSENPRAIILGEAVKPLRSLSLVG